MPRPDDKVAELRRVQSRLARANYRPDTPQGHQFDRLTLRTLRRAVSKTQYQPWYFREGGPA